MQQVLLKNITIIDSSSSNHKLEKDILIEGDKIVALGNGLSTEGQVFDGTGLYVSQGWFDLRAHFSDPGEEFKEDLSSGCQAALNGGFTDVALLPNTTPVIQARDGVAYLKAKSFTEPIALHALGAVTQDCKGEALAEMHDMHKAGAVAFTDGQNPITHTGILLKTLQYLQKEDLLLMNRPVDAYLSKKGLVHEGYHSTRSGFPGIPSLGEEMGIKKSLDLLKYTGGKIHFSCISTKEGVQIIREAKAEGLEVTCDIAVHQLAFDDSVIERFDTVYKVNPPFRTTADIEALREGLADGTIDIVVSDHTPQDIESKRLEFNYASYGVTSLETCFAALNSFSSMESLEVMINKITHAPRQLLNLDQPVIEQGNTASLTIFDPNHTWEVSQENFRSKSFNSPFLGLSLKGKPLAVHTKGTFHIVGN